MEVTIQAVVGVKMLEWKTLAQTPYSTSAMWSPKSCAFLAKRDLVEFVVFVLLLVLCLSSRYINTQLLRSLRFVILNVATEE
jgi:hypothetical protein